MGIINIEEIVPKKLEGRDLYWIATPKTIGTEQLSFAIMHCHPHAVVRPMHAHLDIEEVLMVLSGQGEAWIDGEKSSFRKGDAVLLPANSKHQVRNTGDEELITVSIFAGITSPENYINYEGDAFKE